MITEHHRTLAHTIWAEVIMPNLSHQPTKAKIMQIENELSRRISIIQPVEYVNTAPAIIQDFPPDAWGEEY